MAGNKAKGYECLANQRICTSTVQDENCWYVDSGMSLNIFRDKKWMQNISHSIVNNVKVAVNKTVAVKECSNIDLRIKNSDSILYAIQAHSEEGLEWHSEMGGLCFEDGETVVSISSEDDCGADLTAEIAVANKPVKDIWPADDIWSSVQALPGSDEILPLLEAGLVDAAATHAHGHRSALLCATVLGRYHLLERLLATEFDVDVRDDRGRSALHLSCLLGGEECARVLLAAGADPNAWDADARATPLHCAASARNLACLKLLIRHGADVNAGIAKRSALHYAVLSDAPACVMELLQNGACPDTPQVQQETPLHAAAAAGSVECARLLLAAGADARAQLGAARATALHLAAEDGHAECARLLLDSGAHIEARNARGQTPLHIACLAQSLETVELLVSRGAATDARDADGRAPLHGAIVRGARSCDVARTLLAAGADPNLADNFGYTPLHVAALHEFSGAVCLLIDYGGDVTLRTNGGVSALAFIVRRTPDVLPRYLAKFDAAVRSSEHELGDVDCELRLDFRPLVPCLARGETELALAFIDVGRRDVLKHPLCETFLFLKWKRIRKFFILGLVYHAIFVSLFSVYVISVFRVVNRHQYAIYIAYVIIVLNICFMAKELFQIRHSWLNYIKQWENWLQWIIITGVFICTIPFDAGMSHHAPAVLDRAINETQSDNEDILVIPDATWRHEVAAITIFCCWLELMMIVGRFPTFGLYVQMFTTVAVNFATFLMAYCCLLVAFGLAFVVLFANYASFANILPGLIKTVMMMSGELEYEDIFYSDRSPIQFPLTTHVLFLLFVLLVTVILTNLLVGLAVSDIQALQESAGLDRLVRQAQLVAHLESMLFSRLLSAPRIALAVLRRGALLTASPYRAGISIRPNDPRENRIPKDLIASVYKLVVSRKPERKSVRKKDYRLEIMKPKQPEANPKKEVVNRRSNLFETYSSEIQQSGVERRKRTSSNSADSRQRPMSCFSTIPDVCFTDIRSQIAEMNKKVDKWLEATEAKLNSLEQKIEEIRTDRKKCV